MKAGVGFSCLSHKCFPCFPTIVRNGAVFFFFLLLLFVCRNIHTLLKFVLQLWDKIKTLCLCSKMEQVCKKKKKVYLHSKTCPSEVETGSLRNGSWIWKEWCQILSDHQDTLWTVKHTCRSCYIAGTLPTSLSFLSFKFQVDPWKRFFLKAVCLFFIFHFCLMDRKVFGCIP